MNDLIDKKAALDAIKGVTPWENVSYLQDAIAAVKAIPSVPAEVVRHGRWLRTSPATWDCSVCHAPYRGTPVRPKSRYCHNCGARMDGQGEEDAE